MTLAAKPFATGKKLLSSLRELAYNNYIFDVRDPNLWLVNMSTSFPSAGSRYSLIIPGGKTSIVKFQTSGGVGIYGVENPDNKLGITVFRTGGPSEVLVRFSPLEKGESELRLRVYNYSDIYIYIPVRVV